MTDINKQKEFLKTWSREAINQPGLPIETVTLTKEPFLRKPIMRKSA